MKHSTSILILTGIVGIFVGELIANISNKAKPTFDSNPQTYAIGYLQGIIKFKKIYDTGIGGTELLDTIHKSLSVDSLAYFQ